MWRRRRQSYSLSKVILLYGWEVCGVTVVVGFGKDIKVDHGLWLGHAIVDKVWVMLIAP